MRAMTECAWDVGFQIAPMRIPHRPRIRPLPNRRWRPPNTRQQVMEFAYVDVGLHPVMGSDRLPSEVDLVLRNDNLGENGLDTIELFSDRPADLWFHYFEDRTGILDSDLRAGTSPMRVCGYETFPSFVPPS